MKDVEPIYFLPFHDHNAYTPIELVATSNSTVVEPEWHRYAVVIGENSTEI